MLSAGRRIEQCVRAILLACLAGPLYPAANAVAAEGGDEAPALQEITVTASRMGAQSIQSLPMAISAVSADSLERRDLTSVMDFSRTLSSVNVTENSPGENRIEMRGLVTAGINNTDTQDRSLVALYVDDAPVTLNPFNPDLRVLDLERVEVLRGPQGTLYGAGSMAGTIRLITRKPNLNEAAGSVAISGSGTQQGGFNYDGSARMSLPLIPGQLAMSVALYRSDDSGFIDNVNAAAVSASFAGHIGTGQKDANESAATQARVALYWHPSDLFDVEASFIDARLTNYGTNNTYTQLGTYATTSIVPERFDDEFKLANLTLTANTDFGNIASSTSYVDRHFNDSGSTPYEFLGQFLLDQSFGPGASPVFNPQLAQQINDVKDFTEELRFTSPQDKRFRYTTGVFYEHVHRYYLESVLEKGFDQWFAQFVPGFNSPQFYGTPEVDDFFWGPIDITERQFAAFGEATFSITPKLDVTAGVRYYNFKQDFNLFFTGLAGALDFNQPLTGAGVEKSSGANPRGVVSFKQTQDVMWYAEAARGFRYGGVNEPVPQQFCDPQHQGLNLGPQTFGPDKLWNYSIGEKGKFGPLTLNADAFFIDWKDAQIRVDLACGYYYEANLGHLHSKGAELDTHWRINRNWTVGLSGSYTDAALTNNIPQIDAVAGDRAPYFPKLIATVSAEYGRPLGKGRLGFTADYTYRTNAFTQFNGAQQDRFGNSLQQQIPASRLLNAVLDYEIDHWRVGIFGKNLTNDLGITNRIAREYGDIIPTGQQYISRPRTIGASVRYSF